MPTTLQFRAAVMSDVAAVLDFWRNHAEDTNRQDGEDAVIRLLGRDPDALLLACDAGDVVGSVIAGWDGLRCHLYRIAVRADRRQEGIARQLVAHAERRFTSHGGARADAMVLQDNALGQAAWTALGYTAQPEWRRWVKVLPSDG